MQHFYDGQIRRYLTQTIRVLSNFTVKYADGTLSRIPVLYGDTDRQASNILKQNSENKINSVPRMSVYISGLELDRNRLADATFVGKVNIRERGVQSGQYTHGQGRNYTVEQLMPTPFMLKMKADIWAANTDQKLQILEQLLVLFNPSLEIQTNDNYIDWTSLSVLNLQSVVWSNRSIPVGNDSPIDVATLELDTPIWISPPVKVKQMGVITSIITSLYSAPNKEIAQIEGLGSESVLYSMSMESILSKAIITITDYKIEVYNGEVILLGASESTVPHEPTIPIPVRQGIPINWDELFSKYPSKYVPGVSRIFLSQPTGDIVGTFDVDHTDNTKLLVNWDVDTLVPDTLIDSFGRMSFDTGFDQASARGRVDAIIDPSTYNPKRPLKESSDQPIIVGIRYLIIEDIGDINNTDGPSAWKALDGTDLVAHANDLIEWDGTKWNVIFDSLNETNIMVWQTNIYTGVQYLWNGVSWVKSFEGVYDVGQWRIEI